MKRTAFKRRQTDDGPRRFSARRKPLPKVNRKRKAKRDARTYAEQSDLCRYMPCAACHPSRYAPGADVRGAIVAAHYLRNKFGEDARRSDPHHVRTRGAGGLDSDTAPLCRDHHMEIDAVNSGPKTFEAKYGVSLKAIAAAIHQAITKESAHADA